jgi:hypothetical protein
MAPTCFLESLSFHQTRTAAGLPASKGLFSVQYRQVRFQSPCDFIAHPPAEPGISRRVARRSPWDDWGLNLKSNLALFSNGNVCFLPHPWPQRL